MGDVVEDRVTIYDDNQPRSGNIKSIGFLEAFSITFNVIMGSGIFIGVGPTFNVFESNSIGMVVIFWIFGGIVALFGGLCYAELGTRIPESGGERAYYMVGLNEKFSITYVIIYIFIVKSICLAALAVTTGSYLASLFASESQNIHFYSIVLAAATLVICTCLNALSKRVSTKTGVFFTFLKICSLFFIICIGFYSMGVNELPEWKTPFELRGFDLFRFSICLINLFWSYEGWNTLGLVAGDMKNPSRDFPIALLTGITVVGILYVLAVISYSAILGYDVVRFSEAVATSVGSRVLNQASFIIPLLIAFSTFGSTNANFYAAGCVIASAGFRGDLPIIFSLVHSSTRTPIIGLLVELIIALVFIMFRFQALLNYSAFISWLIYFVSFCCLMKLKLYRVVAPNIKIFTIPMAFIGLMQAVCLYTVVMCFLLSPLGCGIFGLLILAIFGWQYIPKRYTTFPIFTRIHTSVVTWLTQNLNLCPATISDIS